MDNQINNNNSNNIFSISHAWIKTSTSNTGQYGTLDRNFTWSQPTTSHTPRMDRVAKPESMNGSLAGRWLKACMDHK